MKCSSALRQQISIWSRILTSKYLNKTMASRPAATSSASLMNTQQNYAYAKLNLILLTSVIGNLKVIKNMKLSFVPCDPGLE